jgi:sulfide:quinone oxidoreductase
VDDVHPSKPLHVVVAGGGAAAAEAGLSLREHAGARVRMTLVVPDPDFAPHAAKAAGPFSAKSVRRRSMRVMAHELRARLYGGRVAAVEPERHVVVLADGRTVLYDALVLAVGAKQRIAFEHALTFFGQAGAIALNRLMVEIEEHWVRSVAFVVPPGTTWPLPLYELAMQTGFEARAKGLDVRLRLVTPERAPLEIFGPDGQQVVRELLDAAGVGFAGSATVTEARNHRPMLPEDRVVTLPVLAGPGLTGVPAVADGFIPVDGHGAVVGLEDVFAAGDATDFPIKQADLACRQAEAVAELLAQRAGAFVTPTRWKPVVRAHLLAGGGRTAVLERDLEDDLGSSWTCDYRTPA